MNYQILDLYSDYLLSSFGQTIATGLARVLEGDISHDQITRMLASEKLTPQAWWKLVKPHVRQIERDDGVMIIDDSIMEKPYTDENEIVCWHFDHSKGTSVKGINFITVMYEARGIALPVSFELVAKTERYRDEKTGQEKRRSPVTKNETYRRLLHATIANRILFRYVLNDLWFAAAENMRYVKLDLAKEFIMGLKSNRKAALPADEQAHGRYQRIDTLTLPEGATRIIYQEGVPFPLQLLRPVFTNGDGSTGVRYLVRSDLTLTADELTTIYQRRWKVEEYHRSLKQNAALAKSPTRTQTTQTNHFVAALWSFVKIELLKVRTKKNHYQLKSLLYLSAVQQAFLQLQPLRPVSLIQVAA